MTKQSYLFIYLLMLASFFYIIPFGYVALVGRESIFLIIELLWLWYGEKRYIHRFLNLYKKTYHHFCLILFLTLLPSVFMAYHLFGQGLIQSIISYRNLFLFYAIPVFLKIELTEEDVIRACLYFSICSLIAGLLNTFGLSSLFCISEALQEKLDNQRMNETEIIIGGVTGIELTLIPLYYYCQRIFHKFTFNDLKYIVVLFFIVFIAQNRSTLFPACIVVGFTFIFSDMRPKFIKYCMLGILAIMSIYILKEKIVELLTETNDQITSTYDPRIVAMAYFLDFDRMSIGEILFGTGNISFVTSSYVKNLQEAHIHYSDVGFIGFWSQFGILPILIFLYYIIKAIVNKKIPAYIRLTAATILICGFTISYFEFPIHMIWFVLFYYLMNYSLVRSKESNKNLFKIQRSK